MPAGFDKITICNMALSHVGSESTIESIDEDNVMAKTCKLWYEGARLATLEVYNWTFARRSLSLALHNKPAPSNRYAFRYQLPSDCVIPRMIENPAGLDADAISFEVEEAGDDTLSLITDQDQAVLLYTFNQQHVALFSFHFVLMMSVRLGIFINTEITGKVGISDRLERRFSSLLIEAPNTDADGGIPRPQRDPVWIRDRN